MTDSDSTEQANESPSHVIEITDSDFDALISGSDKPVLVYFWAPWCAPCRQLTPVINDLASQYGDRAVIAKLNTQDWNNTSSRLGIRGIPAIIIINDGKEQERFVGIQSARTYRRAIDKYLS